MRLLLVRHGQTNHNRDSIALGRADVPLNDLGISQAKALGDRLSTTALAAVYSSPLSRALDTARAVAEPHSLSVTVHNALIEMEVGELDGLSYPAIRERYPQVIERWLSESGPEHPFPGGESLVQVADRAWEAIAGLAATHGDETVAAVTHNFVILCTLARALGLPLSQFRRLKHEVAAISVLDFSGESATVISMNDRCHLASD
jgi:broad specificity phosphatase PhoE